MGQVYGKEQAEGATNGSVRGQLGSIATSFGTAVTAAVRAVPKIVGVNLDQTGRHDDTALQQGVRANFQASSGGHPALAGFAFMVFVLLYVPCMATIAAARHELGTRWMWTSVALNMAVAWTAATLVFQVGYLVAG